MHASMSLDKKGVTYTKIMVVYQKNPDISSFHFRTFSFGLIVYHLLHASFIPRTSCLRSCKMAIAEVLQLVSLHVAIDQ